MIKNKKTIDAIGAIRVKQDVSYVQIAASQAGKFAEGQVIEEGLAMFKLDGQPNFDRPERGAAPARKSYAGRDDGDRKPYAPREGSDRKPYAPRADGDRKPYTPSEDGDRKPYVGKDGDAPRKPRTKPEGRSDFAATDKPRGAKTYAPKGADARPSRAAAPKPNFADASVSLRKKPAGKPPFKGGKPGPKR